MILYVNDIKLDLPNGFSIARTKQVNDFNRIDNRQTNYSQRIKLPKTKHNVKSLDFLGEIGSVSRKPYTTLNVKLFNSDGDCEIFKGFAIIRETQDDNYDMVIYDGFISFDKAIENKVLSDTGLAELNHLKNLTTVKETWTDNTKPYRYNVADYNGNAFVNGKLNTDFLIPSVNAKYLWDKVHDFFGFTYEGSVFDTQDFRDLWITYPKAVNADTQQVVNVGDFIYDGDTRYYSTTPNDLTIYRSKSLTASLGGVPLSNAYLQGNSFQTGGFPIGTNDQPLVNSAFTVLTTGAYKITIKGTFFANASSPDGDQINLIHNYVPTNIHDIVTGEYFEKVHYINLVNTDTLSLNSYLFGFDTSDIDVKIEFVTGNAVDFEEAFIDFSVKDFINEVLIRHGLTPFTSKYTNNIEYLTFDEWFNTQNILDWSANKNKYVRTVSEKYTIGNYGKRSYMRYKYNDDNSSHHDSYFIIDDDNLPDQRDIIKSRLFAPDSKKSVVFGSNYGEDYNTYPIWSKEPKDDGIEYKALDNRFYIMRSNEVNKTIQLIDESTGQEGTTDVFYREDFERLGFNEIINQYYQSFYNVLVNSKMSKIEFYLNDSDINNLDFRKLIHIKEKSENYIINKIPNYISKGVYACECIKLDLTATAPNEIPLDPKIILTSIALEPNTTTGVFAWTINDQYSFIDYVSNGATIKASQLDSYTPPIFGDPSTEVVGNYTGLQFTEVLDLTTGVQNFVFDNGVSAAEEGWYEVQIFDVNGLLSNKEYVRISTTEQQTPDPAVYVQLYNTNGVNDPNKEVQFRFVSFTPTTCTITITPWNFLGGHPNGQPPIVLNVPSNLLTPDTIHSLFFSHAGTGWFYVKIDTNDLDTEGVRLCL